MPALLGLALVYLITRRASLFCRPNFDGPSPTLRVQPSLISRFSPSVFAASAREPSPGMRPALKPISLERRRMMRNATKKLSILRVALATHQAEYVPNLHLEQQARAALA